MKISLVMHFRGKVLFGWCVGLFGLQNPVSSQDAVDAPYLVTDAFQLLWESRSGFKVLHKDQKELARVSLMDQYTVLFSKNRPDSTPVTVFLKGTKKKFPEDEYRYLKKPVADALSPVSLNLAGQPIKFNARLLSKDAHQLVFGTKHANFDFKASWSVADAKNNVVKVRMTLKAKESGYYSVVSPSVIRANHEKLAWGMIPGYFQGRNVEPNFINAYFYGHGIPSRSVVVRERTATTLSAIASLNNGLTVAAVPAPGLARVPWVDSVKHQTDWRVGLSLINRAGQVSPSVYFPVLGQEDSYLRSGEQREFEVYFIFNSSGWYDAYDYVVNRVYRFGSFLDLKNAQESLAQRVSGLYRYISNDSLSMWRLEENEGTTIGAQSYLGGVYKANHDAMKNADYGAMWMLSHITGDPSLRRDILKYARNFKVQQQNDTGFFKGAPRGQYYLWKSKAYTEEWGDYIEPIAITYYNLMDIGNMLLFEPGDQVLQQKLREGAERLLHFMNKKGHWAVAYDHVSKKELFNDLVDYRPTFYGMMIAYKLLGDERYLSAAKKGADWFINNSVNNGYFLGVCGDTRFAPDFATAQAAQALMDLYQMTEEKKYLNAAIEVARLYSTYVYTHPIPTKKEVFVKGKKREEWQISQVGLNVEHGGAMGSANLGGPILLSSYSGMYIRFFKISGDSLFLNMARAAALGRDAFVNPKTKVASYYWNSMDLGAGGFPHHAWWQIGWITDYLLSEASLRSHGNVDFPSGFMTPKVGPHKAYGFQPGMVYGQQARLFLDPEYATVSNPDIEYITAINESAKKVFIIFLNSTNTSQNATVRLNTRISRYNHFEKPARLEFIGSKEVATTKGPHAMDVTVEAFGLKVLEVSY